MDNPEKPSTYLPLSIFRVPRYRYFLTQAMKKNGPEQWERLRILQACERLEIPVKLWPKIGFPKIPQPGRPIAVRMYIPRHKIEGLDFPPFNALEETIPEWRVRCHKTVDALLDEYAEKFKTQFLDALKQGIYTKIPQTRTTTDLNLRYEWVAQRICYRTPYKKLAKAGYTVERITQSVNQILKKAGLSEQI
jgi:hypothetical protein